MTKRMAVCAAILWAALCTTSPAFARTQNPHHQVMMPAPRPEAAPQPFAVIDLPPAFGTKLCTKRSHYYPACLRNSNAKQ